MICGNMNEERPLLSSKSGEGQEEHPWVISVIVQQSQSLPSVAIT